MNVRRLRRICSVMGCSNMDTYNITQTEEYVNPVIICEKCLRQAIEAIENKKSGHFEKKPKRLPPPLFGAKTAVPAEVPTEVPTEISAEENEENTVTAVETQADNKKKVKRKNTKSGDDK